MRSYLIMGFVLLGINGQATENLKTIKGQVNKATVYLSGARLTGNYALNLPAGHNTVIIEGVSPTTQANTIEVNGKGNFVVLESRFDAKYPETTVKSTESDAEKKLNSRIKFLSDSINDISMQLEWINEKKATVELEKQILLNNRIIKGDIKKDSVSIVKEAMSYLHEKLSLLNEELFKLKKQVYVTGEQLNAMQLRLEELIALKAALKSPVTPATGPIYCIIIETQSQEAVNGSMEVSYFTGNASWTNSYDIRSENSQKLKLTQKAQIQQYTGTTWDNTYITLSTATPGVGNQAPNLQTAYLYFYEEYRKYKDKAKLEDNSIKLMEQKIVAEPATKESISYSATRDTDGDLEKSFKYTQINENLANVEYEIKLKYTIPSDNKQHQVLIQEKELACSFEYYAVPKLDKNAFLMAKVTNWEDLNLLPGEARIYSNGSYVASNYLNPGMDEDTLNINLGRDRSIEIVRKQIKDKLQNKNINDKTKRNYEYEMVVRNNKAVPYKFVIEDQIPVSNTTDILVALKDKNNAGLDEPSGKLTWSFDLKPKENRKLKFAYEITFPQGKTIAGL